MTVILSFAAALRARVDARLDVLRRMHWRTQSMAFATAWWDDTIPNDCLWLGCGPPRDLAEHAVRSVSFRDQAEALVLLGALSSISFDAGNQVLMEMFDRAVVFFDLTDGADTTDQMTLGLAYYVSTSDDLAPISERIFCVQQPSNDFVHDYKWLKKEIASCGTKQAYGFHPIPVRLHLALESQDEHELAFVLRQVIQAVIAQSLYSLHNVDHSYTQAGLCSRFEILELRMDAYTTLTSEALECLTRLVGLRVDVPRLSALSGTAYSIQERWAVSRCLQVLLEPSFGDGKSSINEVYATDDMAQANVPCLFSAVQTSTVITSFELEVHTNPSEADNDVVHDLAQSLWKWTAYALFSCHTESSVKTVTLHVDYLDDRSLAAMKRVLSADDPLGVVFDTLTGSSLWIKSSEFHVQRPEDVRDLDSKNAVFQVAKPLTVRVIDSCQCKGKLWWRVLLPGCGEAWVDDAEVVGIDANRSIKAAEPVHLKLQGVTPSKRAETLALIRIVAHRLRSLEIEKADTSYGEYDATEWTRELLRSCRNLDRLELPKKCEIKKLNVLVEAAETGNFGVRDLCLRQRFSVHSGDVIAFLGVLGDENHPLTQQLEALSFAVSIDYEDTQVCFMAAWQSMLKSNRTLDTVSLFIYTFQLETWRLIKELRNVDVTRPLKTATKLAFLSVVHDSSRTAGRACRQLDTNVIAIIFAFAAHNRVVNLNCDEY